jgi:hypothetical protein
VLNRLAGFDDRLWITLLKLSNIRQRPDKIIESDVKYLPEGLRYYAHAAGLRGLAWLRSGDTEAAGEIMSRRSEIAPDHHARPPYLSRQPHIEPEGSL